MFYCIAFFIIGFTTGMFVFRNNATKAEAVIQKTATAVEATAQKVKKKTARKVK